MTSERPDRLLSPRDVADETGVGEKTLAMWRYQRIGPSYLKLGGLVRYRRAVVDAWLASCERVTQREAQLAE